MSVALFVAGWLVLLVAVLALEAKALLNAKKRDTLSEQVWALMTTIWGSFLLVSLWFWLTWHFFIEPRFFSDLWLTTFTDDYMIVGAGLLAATFLRRQE